MRLVSLLILLALSVFAKAQNKNPFLTIKYDKVVFYDISKKGHPDEGLVDSNKTFMKFVSKQFQLTPEEAKTFSTKVWQKQSYGQNPAACFDPHLGIVYYRGDSIVAYINVCMGCKRLVSSIDIPAMKQGKRYYEKEIYYDRPGMSESFLNYINDFLKKNNFSHQLEQSNLLSGR